MITFLNFAPIEFMGGSEKWMFEIASKANQKEPTFLIDVSSNIANIYGKLVLKREFKSYKNNHPLGIPPKRLTLTFKNFIPFTNEWIKIHKLFKESRIIYARFEILEIFILIYFAGLNVFRKTVAGMILTPKYSSPQSLFQKLHNFIYNSFLYLFLLRKSYLVHILNKRDAKHFKKYLNLSKVIYLPLGVEIKTIKYNLNYTSNNKELRVIYVGEMSRRKGLDTILSIIQNSPKNIKFELIGDGPMRSEIIKLTEKLQNLEYLGYVSKNKLQKAYERNDVILFPSRGESFGLVMIEAASYGLKIVDASEVSLSLPAFIEYSIQEREIINYNRALDKIFKEKMMNKINKQKIAKYINNNFSSHLIDQLFLTRILDI